MTKSYLNLIQTKQGIEFDVCEGGQNPPIAFTQWQTCLNQVLQTARHAAGILHAVGIGGQPLFPLTLVGGSYVRDASQM